LSNQVYIVKKQKNKNKQTTTIATKVNKILAIEEECKNMGRLIFRQLFPSVLPKFIQSLLVDLLSCEKKKVLTKEYKRA